ncbi:dynein assembly factor with WD repeat domains 1-like [Latimeria chalumnae]|uniref:dynein assembly factor with WD repeat domains 1-like n=1 Tax=Latimeria chalumnae TaxID=7897 RepID=UPI00313DDE06
MSVAPRKAVPSRTAMVQLPKTSNTDYDEVCLLRPHEPTADGHLRIAYSIDCGAYVLCCQFNKDVSLLAVGLSNGTIKIFKTADKTCVYQLNDITTISPGAPATCLRFQPNCRQATGEILLATYADGALRWWHLSTQTCIKKVNEQRQTLVAAFSPSGAKFVTAGASSNIQLYDTETGEKLCIFKPSPCKTVMDGHRSRVFALAFHPGKESEFISGGWDDTVQYWNFTQHQSIRRFFGPHICGDALDIDPSNKQILTGSWRKDNPLQVWDYNTAKKLKEIPNDYKTRSLIYSCHWLGKDHLVAGGSDANMCRMIDRGSLMTAGRLIDLPAGVYSTHVGTMGTNKHLIAVTASQILYMLEKTAAIQHLNTASPAGMFCFLIGQPNVPTHQ